MADPLSDDGQLDGPGDDPAFGHHVQTPPTGIPKVLTPGTLTDALAAVAEAGARPIAGGTDLIVELSRGHHGDVQTLVDLTRVAELDEISVATDNPDGSPIVTLGATVTHNQVVADPRLQEMAVPLVQACREVGSPQLRNRATVVGNLVTASPANDTISALLALDATVLIASTEGSRRVPIGEFYTGFRGTVLEPGELVTGVEFPALCARRCGVFVKLGLRRAQAISVVHVAVVLTLDDGVVSDPRVALGSLGPTVLRSVEAEAALDGQPLGDAVIAAAAAAAVDGVAPIDDVRATADYRNAVTGEMVTRALTALRDDAGVIDENPVLLWGGGDGRWPTGPVWAAEHGPDTQVRATVNGQMQARPAGTGTLLDWLRSVGLTGVKEGCAEGECGACTVDMDGIAVMSCLVPAARAEGTSVVTIEGLSTADPDSGEGAHPLQQAFVDAGAVQCGYCIPGFLMAGSKLLEEAPCPSQRQVVDGLAGNLCRCTGYYKIIDAVSEALAEVPVGIGHGEGSEA